MSWEVGQKVVDRGQKMHIRGQPNAPTQPDGQETTRSGQDDNPTTPGPVSVHAGRLVNEDVHFSPFRGLEARDQGAGVGSSEDDLPAQGPPVLSVSA